MADPVSYGNSERDIEQALIALKKGTQLVKYSRKGKPKFRAFRLSPDETTLIWLSHGDERYLKLSTVTRIIPGQRTAVFKRYLRPEKDYLSFSLLYNNGERSLDLICKDKAETEVWFAGLKALISRHSNRRTKSEIPDNGRPFGATLDFSNSIGRGRLSVDSRDSFTNFTSSDVAAEHSNMQLRTSAGDGFRISVSSTPSCSSGGSGPDDIESLGDVYVWGEVWSDGASPEGPLGSLATKVDVLTPKPLESNVVLDVHQIACGVRHVALVTRQGEVFTWGEESGGRLGHGIERDFSRPRLVDFLAVNNVDFVACGEHHTCAVSTSGDLFTWGDGTHNAGLLGHGTDVSHWIPKRVSGPLEGLQVLSIACGTWHTALATSNGKLFTFGDGSFGALGHGNRESFTYPKEIQLLSGLKSIKVACGVWHTAAIVEVMGQGGSNISSRKLFTWGDGDKYRLGHGSKDTYLLPTCVSPLIDYNFYQLACGHNMTVALTTSGHVFTMGGTAYGQLGNPVSDGKIPCLVQDKLVGEFVEELSCGAYHVAVLTSRSEVFTWGRGANGRLGHGDVDDRKTPMLVEALKDRHVKNISCGSNFTSCICIHKWVSGADQSVCSGCRQAFGFTRKRHNCYNCGLVHCHACSSKKALKAALAPTPGKPHRVCDACYAKLKAAEAGNASNINRKATVPRHSIDARERIDREIRSSRILLPPSTEAVKYLEIKSGKPGAKTDSPSIVRASQVPSLTQLKDIAFPSSFSAFNHGWWPVTAPPPPPLPPPPTPQPAINSRPSSPYSRRPSPPRTGFSRTVIERLKKSNEVLTQDIAKLQNQIRSLKNKCDAQNTEMSKLQKNAEDAALLVAGESSKLRATNEVVKSIAEQLKEMVEKLPPEFQDNETFKAICAQAEACLRTNATSESSSYLNAILDSSHQVTAAESSNTHDHRTEHRLVRSNLHGNDRSSISNIRAVVPHHGSQNDSRAPQVHGEKEGIEQFEPGVYITFIQRDDEKIFKRVRFSKRRYEEPQAEEWWSKNRDRVFRKYNPPPDFNFANGSPSSSAPSTSTSAPYNPAPTEETDDAGPSS
ncbi:Regulator of chromosome condensation (RCC1) family with FYVE zinc finger domain [Melia azedarach]|uniref:Regulator of chromosome condensation (RCC1) family with FYVE zinc finger domain n=1 Tax=Melia azedarach TaxID=155640 RepID=A0ACC1YFX2_MELAZ|nr:Regulator of chromosome condensation (RCC1) family with FYVE zinc finger domain [Melia azedarach]